MDAGLPRIERGVNLNVVKPVSSGHPRGMLWCPLNTHVIQGVRLTQVSIDNVI